MEAIRKPIVAMSTGRRNETPLEKMVPDEAVKGTFGNLVSYLIDPAGDSLNPPYEGDRRALASRIGSWLRGSSSGSVINIRYTQRDGNKSSPISLDSKIADHAGNMFRQETAQTDEGPTPYTRADLHLDYSPVGGGR